MPIARRGREGKIRSCRTAAAQGHRGFNNGDQRTRPHIRKRFVPGEGDDALLHRGIAVPVVLQQPGGIARLRPLELPAAQVEMILHHHQLHPVAAVARRACEGGIDRGERGRGIHRIHFIQHQRTPLPHDV